MNTIVRFPIPDSPLRIMLVDDCPDFLDAASRYLALQPWAQVVGTGSSAAEAVPLIEKHQPHLVLMDIVMPGVSGIEAARQIKQSPGASPAVVMLSLHDNAEYRYHATVAGADGYIVKADLETGLPRILESLYHGRIEKSPVFTDCAVCTVDLARKALFESEERLRLALEAGDMGIFDWNVDTSVITWSPEHAHLFGLRLDQFDGTYAEFARRVHPADLTGIEGAIEKARVERGLYQQKYRIIRPDREVRWMHGKGRFAYAEDGRAVRMTGVVMDITDAMETLSRLQENQTRLSAIYDGNPQCIEIIDRRLAIREINPAGVALLGLDSLQMVTGKSAVGFIASAYQAQAASYFESVLNGKAGHCEYEIVRGDGECRWVENHAVPLTCPTNGETMALCVLLDVTERKHAEERLNYLVNYDDLTALPSRILFADRVTQALIESRRHQRLIGVMLLDLDRYKTINDTLGFVIGNDLIKEAAKRLQEALRPGDTVERFGGDEFAVLLSDMDKAEDAPLVAQRVMNVFETPFIISGHELYVKVRIGITLHPVDDVNADAEALLRNADTALYRAKESGRSTCQFYTSEMTERAHADMSLECALRHAIERDELTLHYQPIVALSGGRIRAFEALLRWQHPELGCVSPARFIPIAEESGLIIPIGAWVLRTACEQMSAWRAAGHDNLHVAVNVSSR